MTTAGLSAGTATDSFGDTDTLVSIENVVGTRFDDVITEDSAANRFEGGAGNDFMTGAAGDDFFLFENGSGNTPSTSTVSSANSAEPMFFDCLAERG